MRRTYLWPIAALALVLLLAAGSPALAEPGRYAGKTLAEALRDLERQGLRLVYSTYVVRPEMRVEEEPRSSSPQEVLDEILAPHGLEARAAAGGRLVITPAAASSEPDAGMEEEPVDAAADSDGGPFKEAYDEIVVTASYQLYRREPIAPVALSREEISRLPHFGDDLYRTVVLLPGVTGAKLSARFAVRGGFHSQVLVELDGLELYEPFHVKDVQGLFSILDPDLVGGVDLISAAFPVQYGDRMSGVVDIRTAVPDDRRHWRFGLSVINLWAGSSGRTDGGKGHWMGSLRRGFIDFLFEEPVEPEPDEDEIRDVGYWDLFGRMSYAPNPASTLSLRLLVALDELKARFADPGDVTDAETRWDNGYLWLSHARGVGRRAWVETLAAVGKVDRDRDISAASLNEAALVLDRRRMDVVSLKQDWSVELSERHFLSSGFELRRYRAGYDYKNDLAIEGRIAVVRHLPPVGTTSFEGSFSGEHAALYLADRIRIGRLTAELGGRYDHQSLTGEGQLSPRVNLVLDLERAGAVRFGWGLFHQSQRPHELDVQDGETTFSDAERARHLALGWERELGKGFRLRLDAYRRQVDDPRPRFENLFDPFTALPEAQSDRIRIAPQSARAEGVEFFLARRGSGRWNGWLSYTAAKVRDRVDGRDQPRYLEEGQAMTLTVNCRLSKKWHLSLVYLRHTGWPTTAVAGELDAEGELLVTVGPHYAENHPSFQRLDLRANRSRPFKDGTFTFFIDIQNLTVEENVRGFEIRDDSFRIQADGSVEFRPGVEYWPGLVPTLGVSWAF